MQIPFVDLKAHHEGLMPEFLEVFRQVAETGKFLGGPFVMQFETEFAEFCQSHHAIGVSSGADALWLSLLALGVGPGDEVITVPNCFVATAEAIGLCGAKPVFVDIDERTYTMNADLLESAITLRTQAIIPVHIFGQMADMDAILGVARRYGTPVLEDAGHAHGAEYKGRKAGSLGVTGCFSFSPSKNLGAFGEAGAITTDETDIQARLHLLRDHGQASCHQHTALGWNARMDAIQAAVLCLKLRRLTQANAARQAHARKYDELLAAQARVVRPWTAPANRHVYHKYVVRVPNRDEVLSRMAARGVKCGVHYPVPVHLQRAFAFLRLRPGMFPVAERCANEIMSLPIFPELRSEQLSFVVESLKECLADQPEMDHWSCNYTHSHAAAFLQGEADFLEPPASM